MPCRPTPVAPTEIEARRPTLIEVREGPTRSVRVCCDQLFPPLIWKYRDKRIVHCPPRVRRRFSRAGCGSGTNETFHAARMPRRHRVGPPIVRCCHR